LIVTIDLSDNKNAACLTSNNELNVCRVLEGTSTFVVQILNNNPTDGRISALEGTKVGVFGPGEAFDFLEVRDADDSACLGALLYTSGQPRPAP
jgi:hypothetical protein